MFRNSEGKVIYVGKARILRNRVRSYFQETGAFDPKRAALVSKIADIDVVVTDHHLPGPTPQESFIQVKKRAWR